MGFLGRLLKTPDEDEDEAQDEFAAEENGLLMVPSLPGDQEAPATTEGAYQVRVRAEGDEPMDPRQAGPGPTDDAPAQPVANGVDTLDLPAAQSEPEPVPAQGPQPEQGSSDETMNLFRTAALREVVLSPVLKEGIEDVSAMDLLAEARSIRDSLPGGRSAGERKREAA